MHGNSTLTVSLPSSWVKKFNIKKGSELNVEEHDKDLIVSNDKDFSLDKKQFNIGNLKRIGKSYITSSYRSGYDEIHLNYEDPGYIETIQELISKEITGFEIIKQENNYCLIKDITGHSKDEFNNALRRIWLLIIDLSKGSLSAIKKKDTNNLKYIHLMDNSINKFSNYCLRFLIKKGHTDFNKTPIYYHLIKSLENMADQYKDLCNSYLNNNDKIDNNLISLFTKINEHLYELYELFYKYDENKIEELFRKIKSTYDKISGLKSNIAYNLSFICKDIENLLSVLIEINL